MTDTGRMLVWLRETLDAAQCTSNSVNVARWFETGINARAKIQASFITPENPAALAAYFELAAPAAVLRRIDRDRKTLDECTKVLAVDGREYDDAPNLAETVIRNLAEVWGWTGEAP